MAKKNEMNIIPLFATPVMQVQLDFDLEKLTEFAFEMQNKDKKGAQLTNRGGWQSNEIQEEKHEEFIRLKKEITQHLQTYQLEVFQGMKFKKNITPNLTNMWVNINEKHHYNEWHTHGFSALSGTFYIKHDNSVENGDILFKHPIHHFPYIMTNHWPPSLVEKSNEITAEKINFTPKSNMLLIFPSWIEHKVESNLKDDSRISLSFNAYPMSSLAAEALLSPSLKKKL